MKRREVIALFAGATLATPFVAGAQNASKAPKRIAFLPDLFPFFFELWLADMRDLGWTEGQDFIVLRSGIEQGNFIPTDEVVQRVVANKPDLVFTVSTASALALQRASASIPIVMLFSGYPVEAGAADSLAKPGRNVTGNSIYGGTGVWGKMVQLLREAKPDIERIGVLWTYTIPAYPRAEIEPCFAELNGAARSLGLNLHIVEIANSEQLDAALANIEARNPSGLVLTSGFTPKSMSVVMQFAVDKTLPTIIDFDWTHFVTPPHPLLCYGPVYRELVRSSVVSVDKILRGERPGDIPIQLPRRFELVANQKTAKAIGLSFPLGLLVAADTVIE